MLVPAHYNDNLHLNIFIHLNVFKYLNFNIFYIFYINVWIRLPFCAWNIPTSCPSYITKRMDILIKIHSFDLTFTPGNICIIPHVMCTAGSCIIHIFWRSREEAQYIFIYSFLLSSIFTVILILYLVLWYKSNPYTQIINWKFFLLLKFKVNYYKVLDILMPSAWMLVNHVLCIC